MVIRFFLLVGVFYFVGCSYLHASEKLTTKKEEEWGSYLSKVAGGIIGLPNYEYMDAFKPTTERKGWSDSLEGKHNAGIEAWGFLRAMSLKELKFIYTYAPFVSWSGEKYPNMESMKDELKKIYDTRRKIRKLDGNATMDSTTGRLAKKYVEEINMAQKLVLQKLHYLCKVHSVVEKYRFCRWKKLASYTDDSMNDSL